jgi:hypothetical protein
MRVLTLSFLRLIFTLLKGTAHLRFKVNTREFFLIKNISTAVDTSKNAALCFIKIKT